MKEIIVSTLYHYPHFDSAENIANDPLPTTFAGTLINSNNYNFLEIRTESISVYVFVTADLIEDGDDLHFITTEGGLTINHYLYDIYINPDSLIETYRIIEGGTINQSWSVTE